MEECRHFVTNAVGETVCEDTGEVMDDVVLDDRNSWFTYENSVPRIPYKRKSRHIKLYKPLHKYSERRFYEAVNRFVAEAKRMSLPSYAIADGKQIIRKILENVDNTKGVMRSLNHVIRGVIYVLGKKYGIYIDRDYFIARRGSLKMLAFINQYVDVKSGKDIYESALIMLVQKYDLWKAVKLAKEIHNKVKQIKTFSCTTSAGASLYIAAKMSGYDITTDMIFRTIGVSQTVITKYERVVFDELGLRYVCPKCGKVYNPRYKFAGIIQPQRMHEVFKEKNCECGEPLSNVTPRFLSS